MSRPRCTKAQLLASLRKCIGDNAIKKEKEGDGNNNNSKDLKINSTSINKRFSDAIARSAGKRQVKFTDVLLPGAKSAGGHRLTIARPPASIPFERHRLAPRCVAQKPRVETLAVLLRGVHTVRTDALMLDFRKRHTLPAAVQKLICLSWIGGAVLGSFIVIVWHLLVVYI